MTIAAPRYYAQRVIELDRTLSFEVIDAQTGQVLSKWLTAREASAELRRLNEQEAKSA